MATAGDPASLGTPNVYRLTARAVAMCGYTSLEALQAAVLGLLGEDGGAIGRPPAGRP